MEIQSVHAEHYTLPLKSPFKMAEFTVHEMNYVRVTVTTTDGHAGIGEATPSWDVNGETPASVIGCIELFTNPRMLGYSLIGQPLACVDDVIFLMTEVIGPQERFALVAGNSAAKAALEQALLDCVAKQNNQTLSQLLNAPPIGVPHSTTIGILPVEDTIAAVENAIHAGARCIRLKAGGRNAFGYPDFERDIRVINAAKMLINAKAPSVKLIADANQGYGDAATTIKVARSIQGCLDWLEQPILAHNLAGFADIKSHIAIPLMADESLSSVAAVNQLIQYGGVDYFNLKLMKTGGIFSSLPIITMAKANDIGIHLGSMIESALGIVPGIVLYQLRPEDIGTTDLNAFDLLASQIAKSPVITQNGIYL